MGISNGSKGKIDGGTLYIPEDIDGSILINHNLGTIPDMWMCCVDVDDLNLIPYGSCIFSCGGIALFDSRNLSPKYRFTYGYVHPTSGNVLYGQYSQYTADWTETTGRIPRGSQPWKALDVNGNSLPYKWMCVKLSG